MRGLRHIPGRKIAGALAILALVASVTWKTRARPDQLHGRAMGCSWTVEWRGAAPPPSGLRSEISAILEKWEQVLSQWRSDSDLSRYNRGESPTPELARVLASADEIKAASGGAFDHHILEKVHAAGFGPPGVGVDLSSVGKGFAVDRVCERLHELGMRDFVFALAGEVRASGEWPVGIETPDLLSPSTARVVALKDRAIATSGNYRQYRETPGGLVSHIIDPRTGLPVIRPPSAVTVIASDCATASAWATALFVLGPGCESYPPDLEVIWQRSPESGGGPDSERTGG